MQTIRQTGRSAGFVPRRRPGRRPARAYAAHLQLQWPGPAGDRWSRRCGLGPGDLRADLQTPLRWVVMLAPLAFVMFFLPIETSRPPRRRRCSGPSCAVMGLSLASIFLVFTGTSIARAFFGAAAMFAA